MYQGEELGLPDAEIPYEKIQDPWGKTLYPKWQGRDGARTPMPWQEDKKHVGFSEHDDTWLPIPETHHSLAVETQENDESSTLAFTREFLKWRNSLGILRTGDIEFLESLPDHILGFKRQKDGEEMIAFFNLSDEESSIDYDLSSYKLCDQAKTLQKCNHTDGQIILPAYGFCFYQK